MDQSDQMLLARIRAGDPGAFEELYSHYYVYLCLIAEHIVRNPSDAEEIVSDVFFRLWKNREKYDISVSLKGYLIRSVRNSSLNFIEQNKQTLKLNGSLDTINKQLLAWDADYPLGKLYEQEVTKILEKGIDSLPDGCREIFLLSRNDDLKYSEIASKLGISLNTVKTQMKIALSRLRENLKEFLAIIIFFILV